MEDENMRDAASEAKELLSLGVECLREDNIEEAIEILSSALELYGKCPLLYINRASAYARLGKFTEALEDCETAVELKPDWPEAYARKGTVLLELFRHRHAHCAFTRAHELHPSSHTIGRGKFEALTRLQAGQDAGYPRVVCGPLQDKSVQVALRADPMTRHLMEDPEFVKVIEEIRKDPKAMSKYTCQGDYKIAMCVAVAKSCDVNKSEQDFLNVIFPEQHKRLVQKYSDHPWTPEYSPITDIHIPSPAGTN